MPAEWDCTGNVWGNSTQVTRVRDGGREVDLVGWHPNAHKFAVGDTLLLRNSPNTCTRYLLEQFRRAGDPRDMWFGTASFFPHASEGAR